MAKASFRASNGDRGRMQQLPDSADDLPETVSVDLDDKDPENFEIVEVDDTPERDRGRPTKVPDDLAEQETDLRGLSRNAQKRIDRLRFETETQRRGREQAERERDAAVQGIKDRDDELNRYRLATETGNTALVASMRSERENRIAEAERRVAAAHAEGNSAELAKATKDLGMAQAELVAINTRASQTLARPAQQAPAPVQQQPQNQLAPRVNDWINRNRSWFDVNARDAKSAEALSIHYKLKHEGIEPTSEEYTRELDRRLKAVYPEHQPLEFSSEDDARQARSTPRRTNTVADSSRETNAGRPANPRTVELTRSELSIAKRLGVSPQRYAAEKVKRMQREQQDGAQ